jgi:phenylacetate-coenzyme A ligase PaaK-like adenylate-forming protein
MAWDTGSASQQQALQAKALRAQLVDAVGPFSPFWRSRLTSLGSSAEKAATPSALQALPAVGERDVAPDGSPTGMAAVVLQAGESGWALHAEGPQLRKALNRRLIGKDTYRAMIDADTRPTSFVFAGLGFRWPVASTRSDLDVVARAGARLWQVLGLTSADVLVCGLPLLPTGSLQALQLGALGAGSPALFPGPDAIEAALKLVPATVLALESGTAAAQIEAAVGARSSVRTVLLVGAPSEDEREDVEVALERAGCRAKVRAAHVPDGHRLMWAECAQGGEGLHTYPDLDLVQVVDAETGEAAEGPGPHELVLTQLGLRGSALLRWRTGDLVDRITSEPCPKCRRTVPRVIGARRRALVPDVVLRSGRRGVDLRAVSAALLGRSDVADWRVIVGKSARSDNSELLVHVIPHRDSDVTDVAVAVARDVRAASGLLPTQVVVEESGSLPAAQPLSRRVHTRLEVT